MPLFKQVTAQHKRSKRKAEALLSDEEDDYSDSDLESIRDGDSQSGSGSDEEDSEDDEELLGEEDGEDEEEEEEEVQVLDEDEPRPPPVGFPTAKEAIGNTIASTAALIAEMDAEKGEGEEKDDEDEDDQEEEAPLVCVVCPNKILKPGKMVEVHLASKDHTRRFNRFKTHVESSEFDSEHFDCDARWVASQLDKAVLARLSAQTQLGGKKAAKVASSSTVNVPTPVASTSSPTKQTPPTTTETTTAMEVDETIPVKNPLKKRAISEAEASGVSVREQLRQKWKQEKKERAKKRKLVKKEKFEERKKAKIEAGEKPDRFISSKPRFVEKIRPTPEEIETRQAWKKARNEAKSKGLPLPPKPVLAYELGGKVPVEEKKETKSSTKKKEKKGGEEKKNVANGKKKGKGKKDTEGTKEPLLPEV